MSHYTTLQTRISDIETLVEALADMGFEDVEVFDQARPLVGWLGDRRSQGAEVIIRRCHVGQASNDIGFTRGADGTFEALISEYDRSSYDHAWLGRLAQRYAYRKTRKALSAEGFDLVAEAMDDSRRIHMTVRRMA